MFHDFFARSPVLAFPLFSLLLFGAIFTAAVVYVARRGPALEARGMLPLEDEMEDEAGHE